MKTKNAAIFVIAVNVFIGIIGLTIVGASVWTISNTREFVDYVATAAPGALDLRHFSGAGADFNVIRKFGSIALATGITLVLATVAASVGAFKHNQILIILHMLLMLLLFLGLVYLVIFVFLFGDELQSLFSFILKKPHLLKFFSHTVLPGFSFFIYNTEKYKKQLKLEMAMEMLLNRKDGFLVYANQRFNCCGIENSAYNSGQCGYSYPPVDKCVKGSFNCGQGCFEPFYKSIYELILFTGILIAISFCLLSFSGLASVILFRSLRQSELIKGNNLTASKTLRERQAQHNAAFLLEQQQSTTSGTMVAVQRQQPNNNKKPSRVSKQSPPSPPMAFNIHVG